MDIKELLEMKQSVEKAKKQAYIFNLTLEQDKKNAEILYYKLDGQFELLNELIKKNTVENKGVDKI